MSVDLDQSAHTATSENRLAIAKLAVMRLASVRMNGMAAQCVREKSGTKRNTLLYDVRLKGLGSTLAVFASEAKQSSNATF
ncbi:hypothetical protein Q8W71_21540 [Methylobacterium sp. NEAU 140]|uniref:hypothetical protein n=1 Tax=Methylobacterium sp. NEAU 140 TaxID=3064945 RepID=UPI0027371C2B|nr:hypothetical protein [Methylobacterium sp. NEAU 140]MDP4025217.1 hypothetical protein [Methylobacterium sp. NEAU 140]